MSSCCSDKNKIDYLFYIGVFLVSIHFILAYFSISFMQFERLSEVIEKFLILFIPGVIAGIIVSAVIEILHESLVFKVCGKPNTVKGVIKASFAGILFDVCNHGVLVIANKLHKKGLAVSQVIAFLVSTPWNSFTTVFVMVSLIGVTYAMLFVVLSFVIAIVTGLIFLYFERKGIIDKNPTQFVADDSISLKESIIRSYKEYDFSFLNVLKTLWNGVVDSKMIIKWLLLGVIIAAYMEVYVETPDFKRIFAPTIIGLLSSLAIAAVLEVCSEGTMPVASQILNIAGAKGNAFAVLMGGVATDYTEFVILRDMTSSIKIPILLMVITIPQIIVIGYILNII